MVAVELDEAVVDVAKKWFGFVEDERMKVEVCDGLQYVRTAAEKGERERERERERAKKGDRLSNINKL